MFQLEKEKTGSTPYILIQEDQGYMKFQGESFHENVPEFYADVTKWLRSYLKGEFAQFTFDCELKYFNSSTAKLLLNMLLWMDEAAEHGKCVTVNWITTEDNEINIECGEDFAEEVEHLTFQMVVRSV